MSSAAVLLTAAVLALGAPGTFAYAGQQQVCNLVSDPVGDADIGTPTFRWSSKATDIVSLDIATGRRTLVAVLRLASTAVTEERTTISASWQMQTSIWGMTLYFNRKMVPSPGGPQYTNAAYLLAGRKMTEIQGLTVIVDNRSIRWTIPRASLPFLSRKNGVFAKFFAQSQFELGQIGKDFAPDSRAYSPATYRDRSPSCVKPA